MINNARARKQSEDASRVPPEVDFRGGERGKYAHLFGEATLDEELSARFLRDKGFEVHRVNEDRLSKTPDFRLLSQGKLVAYCEVKTFERDVWIDKMLDSVCPGELTGGVRNDPIYNRIANAIHMASKQLVSMNPDHEALNILVLVNRDKQAKYQDLVSVTTGKWDPLAGIHDKTHVQFSEGRIREEKYKIDLYVWLDTLKEGQPELRGYFFGNYGNRPKACSLFGIDAEAVKSVA